MQNPTASPFSSPLAPTWLRPPEGDLNRLDGNVWSSTASRTPDGELLLGGVRASELLERFGSPLYVVDEADMRTRAEGAAAAFAEAFRAIGAEVELHYASKAFLSIDIARWMAEAGLGLDVASGGELEVALAAGIEPARIGLHGNNKSRAEIRRAVEAGLGSIIVDSLQEIERIGEVAAELGRVQPVMIRLNAGIHASTHSYLATSHEDQKFGLTFDVARTAAARIRELDSLELLGLHSHIGSSIYEAAGFGAAAEKLMRFRAELLEGGPVPEVNLGGGFGIAYLPSDDAPTLDALARGIAGEVARVCEETGSDMPRITFEPGRAIAGPAGTTLYTVGTTKDVSVPLEGGGAARRRYVAVDGGMSDNIRPALYGSNYCARLANRVSEAAPQLVRVVGKHCESGDIVVHDDYLPEDVAPDDLLAVPATGAYCWSMASHYNYLDRPAVVAVRDGSARTLVRRITIDDLLAADTAWTPEENS
ncbi:diaminopimelate decarboxylase [Gulosibacter sp. 10]|uniref:diaminopimelate decarboxylase n=1 Tax=Gulosibacter sp. 10 TaxID=1255570 RepID=UPI00097E822D|nr:diaminopimelate decarboxylase [Gulosibacter sp. 10]SJM57628.1 Diaminopimelate decarboxylase [Gulosibacter sp. 10]